MSEGRMAAAVHKWLTDPETRARGGDPSSGISGHRWNPNLHNEPLTPIERAIVASLVSAIVKELRRTDVTATPADSLSVR
jgi:hypothetical protein